MKRLFGKKIIAAILCMQLLVAGVLTGCSGETVSVEEGKSTVVLSIEDYDVTLSETYLYLIQYCYNNSLDAAAVTEIAEAGIIDTTMKQLKLEVVEYLLAVETGIEPSEEKMAEAKVSAENFYNYFGADFLGTYGIDLACVEDLFVRQAYINAMTDKAVSDLSEEYLAQFEKDYADLKFHTVYYALFPSIEYDAEGNAVKDDAGNAVPLSEEVMNEQLVKAEELRSRALAGESMEDLVTEYGIAHCSGIERNYEGAYAGELNDVVASLAINDISEVVKTDAGYMVVRMDNPDDLEYKDYMIRYLAYQNANQLLPTMQESWMSQSGAGNIMPDQTVLEQVDVAAICKDMTRRNLSIDQQ